jgi:hypothetical protein
MDVKKFQDLRNTKLSNFEKQYTSLKTQYSAALAAAINEPDLTKREPLVLKVLSINSEMSAAVKDIMSSINEGTEKFDPKTLTDLTNDLIQYQKEYNEISESKDKLQTLKIIQNTTNDNLSNAEWMYNFYLFGLIALIFFVIYLVFNTPSYSIFSRIAATVSAPAVT